MRVRVDSIKLQVLSPSRHVLQEKPDFVEYVRKLINVQLKDVLFLLVSFLIAAKDSLWFLSILVVTKFSLWVLYHFLPENLNHLRVGTMLKRCLDHEWNTRNLPGKIVVYLKHVLRSELLLRWAMWTMCILFKVHIISHYVLLLKNDICLQTLCSEQDVNMRILIFNHFLVNILGLV